MSSGFTIPSPRYVLASPLGLPVVRSPLANRNDRTLPSARPGPSVRNHRVRRLLRPSSAAATAYLLASPFAPFLREEPLLLAVTLPPLSTSPPTSCRARCPRLHPRSRAGTTQLVRPSPHRPNGCHIHSSQHSGGPHLPVTSAPTWTETLATFDFRVDVLGSQI